MVVAVETGEHPIRINLSTATARIIARQLQLAINRHQHFAGAQPLVELDVFLDRLVHAIINSA